ncbi:glycosyltransferase family 2 protein [Bifidobacterium sp. ESL0775]|uniref:glycosyltransferase family 2 protein n=1 Tax=Bifidobacterium sp. ESL0775 TaxID=2983230 RepID=UPI0023F7F15A|nr:glycosyltransferase family 2 protein [Bifidobacterium sp. ESL0775]WEV69553.1 glycosyltransferase family 2 protein [Bifidobacterium sp. ESL0775]
MRIAAGMVTFNPSLGDLRGSVPALLKQVEALVVVDNGSGNADDVAAFVGRYPQVTLLRNGKNLGVASALNRIFEWAEKAGFDWVLTLDDDSEIPDGMIDGYRKCLEDWSGAAAVEHKRLNDSGDVADPANSGNGRKHGADTKKPPRVGIVCPLLVNRKDGTVFHSKRNESECITSGSLTNVVAWRAIGGFDDWLFIDGVDFDFSRRLVAAGYPIVECKAVLMPHQIGESRTVNLGFKHPIAWNHAPFRWYYIERNALYVDKKLGTYSWPCSVARIAQDMLIVLLFERDKGKKIGAMLRGWRAGKRKIREMSNRTK